MKPAFLLPLALFLAAAAVFAWRLASGEDPRILRSALIDKPVPAFSLPPLEGRSPSGLSTADLGGGRVSLVNVWASWCTPCRAENGVLLGLKARGLTVHGLVYKDKQASAREFLSELGDPFARVGFDADGRVAIDWGVTGVPETYVVDGRGIIVAKHVGPLDEAAVDTFVLPAVKEGETRATR